MRRSPGKLDGMSNSQPNQTAHHKNNKSQSAPIKQLQPGDRYDVVLQKMDNSLGLNVTVS